MKSGGRERGWRSGLVIVGVYIGGGFESVADRSCVGWVFVVLVGERFEGRDGGRLLFERQLTELNALGGVL